MRALLCFQQRNLQSVLVAILSGLSEPENGRRHVARIEVVNVNGTVCARRLSLVTLSFSLRKRALTSDRPASKRQRSTGRLATSSTPKTTRADYLPQPQSAEIAVSEVGDLWKLIATAYSAVT